VFNFGYHYQQDYYILFFMFNINATLFKIILQLCPFLSFNAIKIYNYLIFKKLLEILKHVLKTKMPIASILPKFP